MTFARRPNQYETGRAGARSFDVERIVSQLTTKGLADMLGMTYRVISGDRITVLCPEHPDRQPSCSLTPAPNGGVRARCFACGWTGDHFGLVGAVRGLRDFREQLEELAAMVGIVADDARLPRPRPSRQRQHIGVRIDQEAERWLRGLDVKFTAEEAEEIGAMREGDIKSLMGALTAADLERREQQDQRDDELERLADAFDEHDRRRTAAYLEGKWPTPQRRLNGT